jgi:type III pantothenate kinase
MTRRLLIDAGNTRLKWRCMDNANEVFRDAVRYAEYADDWSQALPSISPESIWVGSVAGAVVDNRIADWARAHRLPAPVYVGVEREALGLRVGYRSLSRLGVDRYLAMLGARTGFDGALCVVDIGTAMTLDAIDADGEHKGGLIAPGPQTMMRSLLDNTANIGDASDSPPATPFARDTADAVSGGACFATAALIDRFVHATSSAVKTPVTLLLAGGGRSQVLPLLQTPGTEAPDLVFDGLLALARRHDQQPVHNTHKDKDNTLP